MTEIELPNGLTYSIKKDEFFEGVPHRDVVKYLKGIYRNLERYKHNFSSAFKEQLIALRSMGVEDRVHQVGLLERYFEIVEPFTYEEAFNITNSTFRAVVFGSIDVRDMIHSMGAERISVEGKAVRHKIFKEDGSYEMKDYDVIYELYKVKGEKLNITDVYCVKCWCTTTNKEHWLWVETEYALKGPLEAIASNMRVYENMLPHIKAIKRQGDVLLFEMEKEVIPSGKIVPLTADFYFSKLEAQS